MPHTSDAVVDNGEYQDDTILLNGVELAVESPINGGMVSEFASGLKIGRATYDEREHAFFISLEDFSGGFGFRSLDVREAGGTHWDNAGGVDLRRPRHITLPGRRNTLDPPSDPALSTLFASQNSMLYSTIGSTAGRIFIGVMEDIYTLDPERNALTRVYDGSADSNSLRIGTILESVDTAGARFLLATGTSALGGSGLEYVRSPNGNNGSWVKSSNLPATPSGNASMQMSAAIVWDGQVIAHAEGDSIISSSNGIAWAVDPDNTSNLLRRWRTGSIAIGFVGTAMAPWGEDAIFFIDNGSLWILDFYLSNAVRVRDLGDRNILRVGTVWGGSVIVTDGWNVWEYNPGNAQTVRRIGLFGKDGPPLSAISQTGHAGLADDYHIVNFIAGTSDLFALCRSLTVPQSWRLAVYNGVGWSWFGSEVASSQPYAATVGAFPIGLSLNAQTRAIDVACLDAQNGTDFTLHTIHLPPSGDIPQRGAGQRYEDGPLAFETGWFDGGFSELEGAVIRLTLDGFHLTATETVRVEYRLNNDEDASYQNLGTYTQNQQEFWFGELHQGIAFKSIQFRITLDRGIGVEFADSGKFLDDGTDINASDTAIVVDDGSSGRGTEVFRIGDVIRMDDEQMLVTAIVSGTETLTVTRAYNSTTGASHTDNTKVFQEIGVSPELQSLILVYDKVPHIRTAWTIRIDVSRMVARNFELAGETATVESIWQFLKSVVNTPTLARLVIPSLESGGINVRITDMPATISDFRKALGGRGFVQLQMIETVGP